jgi:hypothetical protein
VRPTQQRHGHQNHSGIHQGEAIGVAASAGQAEGETYALLFGSGFIVQVMSSQQVDARADRS